MFTLRFKRKNGDNDMNTAYYDLLFSGMEHSGLTVRRIVHGYSWTAAELSNGSVAAAMHTEGDSVPRRFPTLEGLPVREAARAVLSWNMEEANEGMAVINAFYNTPENAARLCSPAPLSTSLFDGIDLADKVVGFVGHLVCPGRIPETALAGARRWFTLERSPKPGDYPDSACEYLLPEADVVVITGSAAMNKTMPRLLELSHNAEVIITGPSTPMCPALLPLGIRRLSGLVVTKGAEMLADIVEHPGPINAFGRYCNLG